MPSIRIRVGASLDRSIDVVFGQVEAKAKRTGKAVERNLVPTGKGGPYRAMMRDADVAFSNASRASRRSADTIVRDQQRAARETAKFYQQIGKIAERETMRATRAQQRAQSQAARLSARAADRFATRTSHRATRFFWPNMPVTSGIQRVGSDLLRGAGVDISLQSSVSRSVDLQKRAAQLSNAGFMRGRSGPAGVRQDPNRIIEEARNVGDQTAIDPGQALSGLQAFVAKTGDLATGRAVLADMARLSQATGAELEHMINAAGDVASAFGDAATSEQEAHDKAAKIQEVMRVIAGQGKEASVEVKDLASQMAKVSTSATAFTGDRSKNLATMGALAQMARQRGGAATANIAATSVSAFVNTLRTPARAKNFANAGVAIEAGGGKFRDPQEIIIDALKAAGTDTGKFKSMFANVQGARSVEGFRQIFLEAGGGAAGETAVRKKFSELGAGAALTGQEEADSLARQLDTTAAKAQKFQNQLDRVIGSMADNVMPELEKLAPDAVAVTKAFSGLVQWAAKNPGELITAAIVGSIARAGLESAMRAAIEKSIMGVGGVGGYDRTKGFGGGLGVAGNLAAGLTIASMAVTALTVGVMTIDNMIAKEEERQKKEAVQEAMVGQNVTNARIQMERGGQVNPETRKALEESARNVQARIARAEKAQRDMADPTANLGMHGVLGDYLYTLFNPETKDARKDAERLDELKGDLRNINTTLAAAQTRTQNVRVVNIDQVKVDPAGRAPPPGP